MLLRTGDRLQLHGLPPLRRALDLWPRRRGRSRFRRHLSLRAPGRQSAGVPFLPELRLRDPLAGAAAAADGRRRLAVNLRLVSDPERVAAIPIDHFDGLATFEDLPRDGRCVGDMWF